MNVSLFNLIVFLSTLSYVQGIIHMRCFDCRSRGELGSCKDPFLYTNASTIGEEHGVSTVPCTSGWCRKSVEKGSNAFKDEEYGAATERACLLRGPKDGEERCAYTTKNHERVYMCFCQGDLCNAGISIETNTSLIAFLTILVVAFTNLKL